MSVKQERIEGIIRKEISEIIQRELKDPDLGFVTITDVECTNDYSFAKIYVTFLQVKGSEERGLEVLNKAKGLLRSHLAKKLTIRKTPELIFKIDRSFDEGGKIESLLKKIQDENNK